MPAPALDRATNANKNGSNAGFSKVPVMSGSYNPLRGAVEVLPDRLYFCALKSAPPAETVRLTLRHSKQKAPVHLFNVDSELVYWNFFQDFGPLNLGQLRRFCTLLEAKLKEHAVVCLWSSCIPAKRTNAIYLMAAWQVLHLDRSPAAAARGFLLSDTAFTKEELYVNDKEAENCSHPPPVPHTSIARQTVAALPPFHDASPYVCNYRLTLIHCLEGLEKAKKFRFFGDWDTFDVDEYEHFEQVENGDLNWIIYGKILAFAGPSYKKNVSPEGYCTLAPSDYIPYFMEKNVGLVVRLNQKNYDEQEFIDAGIDHLEQYYLDGSCPPMNILYRVLAALERVPRDKAFAIHCKAGLGRTGTCIGAYLMKHYGFTAPQAIAWMRICRPGCVIGPQQQFLQDLEPIMFKAGDEMRWGQGSSIQLAESSDGVDMDNNVVVDDDGMELEETPTSNENDEDVGQAAGLLSRRHLHQQQHHHHHQTTPQKEKVAPGAAAATPVPITPDISMTSA